MVHEQRKLLRGSVRKSSSAIIHFFLSLNEFLISRSYWKYLYLPFFSSIPSCLPRFICYTRLSLLWTNLHHHVLGSFLHMRLCPVWDIQGIVHEDLENGLIYFLSPNQHIRFISFKRTKKSANKIIENMRKFNFRFCFRSTHWRCTWRRVRRTASTATTAPASTWPRNMFRLSPIL